MSEDVIKDILKNDELAGDILRVLSLFGNVLWESEVRWEIEGMNSTLNREVDISELNIKLETLSEKGIVSLDKRLRGSMAGEAREEYLVRLINPKIVSKLLEYDDKFIKYVEARREAYGKLSRI